MLQSSSLLFTLVVCVTGASSLNLTITPPLIYVPYHTIDVEILCDSGGIPLTYCLFHIPGVQGDVNLTQHASTSAGYTYHGAGLDQGQCGVKMALVSDDNSGNVMCTVGSDEGEATKMVALIVGSKDDHRSTEGPLTWPYILLIIGIIVLVIFVSTIMVVCTKRLRKSGRYSAADQSGCALCCLTCAGCLNAFSTSMH